MLHLDAMRFIASFGILIHHSILYVIPRELRPVVEGQTHGLGLFVDFFFVISGFVITYVYGDRITTPREFGRFMQRRIGRLFPLHVVTMAVSITITFMILMIGASYNSMPSWRAECIVSTVFLVHEIVPCGGLPFNGVNWSISVEMALYALFPVLLMLSQRHAYGCWAICMLATAALAMAGDFETQWYYGYRPIRGIACFSFGMGLFFARGQIARLPTNPGTLVISTLSMVLAMSLGAPVPVCLALVAITAITAVAADERLEAGRLVRGLAALGQLTYSMYMIHFIVFLVVLAALGDKILQLSPLPMAALILFAYALVLGVSLVSYRLFETPARRFIDRLPLFSARKAGDRHSA